MNISGIVVRTRPTSIDSVCSRLGDIDGVDVHGANPDGRIVVTAEGGSDAEVSQRMLLLHDVPGVISVSLIYHHFDAPADEESQS